MAAMSGSYVALDLDRSGTSNFEILLLSNTRLEKTHLVVSDLPKSNASYQPFVVNSVLLRQYVQRF